MDEFALIDSILTPLAGEGAPAFGLGDDAAVLVPRGGGELVVTTDMMVAGRHFFSGDAPDLVARKLLRVNLSDLAAMGAEPEGYLLGLAFADGLDADFVRRFASGLAADQRAFGIALLGGDTVSGAGRLTLSLTALGSVPRGEALMRSGARPGERVYASGTIGDAALALLGFRGELAGTDGLSERYYLPSPRLALGQNLRGLASACIDVSDGLVADLGHICRRSGVGATIEAARLPLSAEAARLIDRQPDLCSVALTGGDDYELVFTVAAKNEKRLAAAAEAAGVTIREIGEITDGAGVTVLDRQGEPIALEAEGFRHG